MKIRALTQGEMRDLLHKTALEGHWFDWQTASLPIGDPVVLGSYASRLVRVVWFAGEFVYMERE